MTGKTTSRFYLLAWCGCVCLLLKLAGVAVGVGEPDTVKVGILHSRTGVMANSESPLIDAASLAIEQINDEGGLWDGRRLEPVIVDGCSDPNVFAREALRLVRQEKISILFGCWTSSSRKAVLKALGPQSDYLLWYPVQYEGEESDPNQPGRPPHQLIYTGMTANQQLIPGIDWALANCGHTFFLVGSDYVYPRTSNHLARIYIESRGGTVLGEVYRPLRSSDFGAVAAQIKKRKPDVVINTVNGQGNRYFFEALAKVGVTPDDSTVISMSVAEAELQQVKQAAGSYAVWSYFASLESPENRRFVSAFRKRFGADRVVDDPIQVAYWQVRAFAKAANLGHSVEPRAVHKAAAGLIIDTPEGLLRIDPTNFHTWKVARVGMAQPDGQFRIVWSSEYPIRPEPFWENSR